MHQIYLDLTFESVCVTPASFGPRTQHRGMSGATEIGLLPVKEGLYPVDPADKTFTELLSTVYKQDGCQRMFRGPQVEHPAILTLFVDWDTVGHHEKFVASE